MLLLLTTYNLPQQGNLVMLRLHLHLQLFQLLSIGQQVIAFDHVYVFCSFSNYTFLALPSRQPANYSFERLFLWVTSNRLCSISQVGIPWIVADSLEFLLQTIFSYRCHSDHFSQLVVFVSLSLVYCWFLLHREVESLQLLRVYENRWAQLGHLHDRLHKLTKPVCGSAI